MRLPPSTLSQGSGESCHVSPRTPLTLLETLTIQRKWRGDSEDSFESCRDKFRNMDEVPREQEGMAKGSPVWLQGDWRKTGSMGLLVFKSSVGTVLTLAL